MTVGKPAGLILSFALPLMIGNVFQQLYTIVDAAIVGRFVGVEALASLGAAEWLQWLVFGILTGATQGFSILTAQKFGADDGAGVRKSAAMSILMTGVVAAAATALSLICAKPALLFLNTPENILHDALIYLTINFGGMIAVGGYNVFASILRAMGNSRAPLVAMIIAASINIALDLCFVIVFRWGVAGAAAATVIAQAFSCLFCFLVVRRIPLLAFTAEDWKPERGVIRRLAVLGTPMAFQNVIIAAGGMTVQYVINGFGFIFVAGFTATNKLYGLLEVAATSFGFSMATYDGQNLGAENYQRIRAGMRCAVKMAVVTAALISGVMFLFGRQILRLFISGDPKVADDVMNVAFMYLCVMSAALCVLYLLHVYRSALQGMGDTVTPMISGCVEMLMRTVTVLFLPRLIGESGVYFAEIAAWAGAAALLIAVYYRRTSRLPHTDGGRTQSAA